MAKKRKEPFYYDGSAAGSREPRDWVKREGYPPGFEEAESAPEPEGSAKPITFDADAFLAEVDRFTAAAEAENIKARIRAGAKGLSEPADFTKLFAELEQSKGGAAHEPTMLPSEIATILKNLGCMPGKQACAAVKVEAEARGKRVTRQQIRDALAGLGWTLTRGRPKA